MAPDTAAATSISPREQSADVDATIREALTREFRTHTSGVDPEHLAFVAERVVRDLMATAWDKGVEHVHDGTALGYVRITEHNPYRR